MTIMTPSEYAALLRQDFPSFIQRSFYELNPETRLLWNWHHEVIASKLEACRTGKIKRLIITVPPRHLKSHCVSIAFVAYLLGHDPSAQVICVSYGQDLADKLARDCRSVMSSPFYQRTFSTKLSNEKQSVQEFVTTKKGFRLATSVGGVLTGRGGDFIIIDDPLKPDEALSSAQRTAANAWFDHTLLSRLNNKETGCIIIIMQRLHEDDLVGHVLAQEGWNVVDFPAIAEQNECHEIRTLLGAHKFTRRAGDVLHPERESAATLQQIQQTIGAYNFAGQYQQAPAPLGGGLVKEGWFRRYVLGDLPEHFDQVVQSWDTANKPTELSDYSVCTTWGVKEKRLYLLNVFRKKIAYPELKRVVRAQADQFSATVVIIEDKASGIQLNQELIEEGLHQIARYKPDGDKIMRLNAQTPAIENGFVYLPTESHWLCDYLHELTNFPKGKHDDQVDSTSQALAWLKQRHPGWGILEYYRRLVDEAKSGIYGPLVKLQVPPEISHVYTLSGKVIMVPANRIIEVSGDDAHPLLRSGYQRV